MENSKTEFKVKGKEMLQKIIELMREGNVQRFIIKDNEELIFMEIPLTIGVLSETLLPLLAKVAALATLVSDFTIEVIK